MVCPRFLVTTLAPGSYGRLAGPSLFLRKERVKIFRLAEYVAPCPPAVGMDTSPLRDDIL